MKEKFLKDQWSFQITRGILVLAAISQGNPNKLLILQLKKSLIPSSSTTKAFVIPA